MNKPQLSQSIVKLSLHWVFLLTLFLTLTSLSASAKPTFKKQYIEAQILDISGTPIKNFEYRFSSDALQNNARSKDGSILKLLPITHPEGKLKEKFYMYGGKQTIVVGAPGYVTLYHLYDSTSEAEFQNIILILKKAAIVEGTIIDEKGSPVINAYIWSDAIITRFNYHGSADHLAVTNVNGHFYSDRFPPETKKISVSAKDYPPISFKSNLTTTHKHKFSFTIPMGLKIHGRFTFQGAPIIDGHVGWGTTISRPQAGKYILKGIPKNPKKLWTRMIKLEISDRKSQWDMDTPIRVRHPKVAKVDIEMPSGTSGLKGTVHINGHAAKGTYGVSIYATAMGRDEKLQITTYANEKGGYSISNMPDGEWSIFIELQDPEYGRYTIHRRIMLSADETKTLSFDNPPDKKIT